MQKNYLLLITVLACSCSFTENKEISVDNSNIKITLYSEAVRDSFHIFIQLPDDYFKNPDTKYPAVFMLDANFHFPMLSATVKQYEKGGMLPPLILVGIGYKSFKLMDSLRVRDYLYPAALPSDEITSVGGGKKFYDFIVSQLKPYIDSNYHTDKSNCALLGHSFGGYFTLYALLNQVETNRSDFKNFISASPSVWYNNFYLNQLTDKFKNRANKDPLNIYLSAGGLEDSTWGIAPVSNLAVQIRNTDIKDINLEYKLFNEMDHMDNSQVTFIKGLRQLYASQQ